jgi:hypothetical protein
MPLGSTRPSRRVLNSLGYVHFERGEFEEAGALFGDALKVNREIGARLNEGLTTGNLGHLFVDSELGRKVDGLRERLGIER